jgi:dihydroxyacetone kinase-like protein
MEIQAKGQAQPGDKTLVDGLNPMVAAMKSGVTEGVGFHELLARASQAAEDGKEASKQLVARFGKAKTLGERAVGFPDAGCVTLVVITRSMQEWAQQSL